MLKSVKHFRISFKKGIHLNSALLSKFNVLNCNSSRSLFTSVPLLSEKKGFSGKWGDKKQQPPPRQPQPQQPQQPQQSQQSQTSQADQTSFGKNSPQFEEFKNYYKDLVASQVQTQIIPVSFSFVLKKRFLF